MNFVRGSSEGLQWNTLRLPATLAIFTHSFPKITTELQLLTPQVDLESLSQQVVQVKNSFAADVISQLMPELRLSIIPAEVTGVSNLVGRSVESLINTIPQASIADLISEHFQNIAESQPTERLPQEETAALQQTMSNWLQAWSPANQFNRLPLILNSIPDISLPKRQERIQLFLEELSQQIRKRKEHVEDGLLRVVERLSDSIAQLIIPPPRLIIAREAVHTSGPPRTHGPVRARGGAAKAYIPGVVLDEAWKPERTLRLLIEKGPEIADGHLTLTVCGEEPSLVGRRADLVFISEWVEVALGSAEIRKPRGYKQWKLNFDLDLATAGLKVRDGTLPPRVLQVIIEPAPKSGKRQRRKAAR